MRFVCLFAALLLTTGAWAQNQPQPQGKPGQAQPGQPGQPGQGQPSQPGMGPGQQGMGPGGLPPNLKELGFTDAEITALQADQKQWEQANKDWDTALLAAAQQMDTVMKKDSIDKAAAETSFRALFDILLKKELARVDLINKWRAAYGVQKAKPLEGSLRSAGGMGPMGQPGMGQQPAKP